MIFRADVYCRKESMKKGMILALAVLYVCVSAGSFFGFRALAQSGTLGSLISPTEPIQSEVPTVEEGNRLNIAAEAPRDQECPLNGQMYTAVEKESWDKRRPLAVMIENSQEARPQAGLSKADIMYEAVVEGGITRFMGVFYCGAQAKDVLLAPVRSARQVFLDYASEYNEPLYAHVGGANGGDTDKRVQALEHIGDYGWNQRTDLNQFSIGYPTFVRNYDRIPGKDVATEHTMETSTERLWAIGEKRGFTNMSPETVVKKKTVPGQDWKTEYTAWKFADDADESKRGTVTTFSNEFWSGYTDFAVKWEYDKTTNTYKRTMGGAQHIDQNTSKQISPKNVVIMEVPETPSVDIHKHNYFQTTGTGKATIFQNGEKIEGTWAKKAREDRTIFTDKKGKQIEFVRGMIWIEVVDKGTEITN
jgi:hypothetical protein